MTNQYKAQMPDRMEAVFDAAYLIFDLIAGILFFAFSHGSSEKIKRQLGIGLQVSSVTMTVFYILLLYIWKFTFPELSGNASGYHMTKMVAAILISFGCYLPVTLLCKKYPKVGLLMIPKTCAYIWMIVMGLQLLF